MDAELLRSLSTDEETQNVIERTLKCIDIYHRTLEAMGVYPPDTVSQAVDSSRVSYIPKIDMDGQYVNVSGDY